MRGDGPACRNAYQVLAWYLPLPEALVLVTLTSVEGAWLAQPTSIMASRITIIYLYLNIGFPEKSFLLV